jgi:hypothetical protein
MGEKNKNISPHKTLLLISTLLKKSDNINTHNDIPEIADIAVTYILILSNSAPDLPSTKYGLNRIDEDKKITHKSNPS